LFQEFGILEVPTILLFRQGEIVDFVIGMTSKEILKEKIANALSNSN
jgi:thioredoxin-like negative regulator of GroEL